jgi:hypothetical protein
LKKLGDGIAEGTERMFSTTEENDLEPGAEHKINACKLPITSAECHRYISLLGPMTFQPSLRYFLHWKRLRNRVLKTEASIGVGR